MKKNLVPKLKVAPLSHNRYEMETGEFDVM